MEKKMQAFKELLEIMNTLREKCPWDKQQTIESLRSLTIEEVYELSDAIMQNNKKDIPKELGDLLLHIVFYSKIGEENGDFDIVEVIESLCKKLIYRHPHIYDNESVKNAKEVEANWEELKLKEKEGNKSVLSGVPRSLPSLIKAYRIQDKVRAVGFDWDKKSQVWDKIEEELNEFKEELKNNNRPNMEDEFGDILFSVINAARLYGINPDNALEKTNQKFTRRFTYLENKTLKQGKSLKEMSLEKMNKIWEEAKTIKDVSID